MCTYSDVTRLPFVDYADQSNIKHTSTNVLPSFNVHDVQIPPQQAYKVDLPRTDDFHHFESGFDIAIEDLPTASGDQNMETVYLRELSVHEHHSLVQSSIADDQREESENICSTQHASTREKYLFGNGDNLSIEVVVDSAKYTKSLT